MSRDLLQPKCHKPCPCGRPCFMNEMHASVCDCFYMGCSRKPDVKAKKPKSNVAKTVMMEAIPDISLQKTLEMPALVKRPSWPETWMAIAHTVGERSYDPRMKVGSIIVSEDNTSMLGLGYNGNYAGGPNVPESNEPGMTGFIHAEINALLKCPYHYPARKVMYVTVSPCRGCAKCVINGGVHKVVYDKAYRDPSGINLLKDAGVEVVSLAELVQSQTG